MPEHKEIPTSAWLILSVAVIAVSSAGIVLQEMSDVKASPASLVEDAGDGAGIASGIPVPVQTTRGSISVHERLASDHGFQRVLGDSLRKLGMVFG